LDVNIFVTEKLEEMEEKVKKQVEQFKSGFPPAQLEAAATIDRGILKLSDIEKEQFIEKYESTDVEVEKFVPASGAATRMFKALLERKNQGTDNEVSKKFIENLSDFPFELSGDADGVLSKMFDDWGFDQLPKGLLPFHKYENGVRTPAHEHLVEAVGYAKKNGPLKIHFTVSPEHIDGFKSHLDEISKSFDEQFDITYSVQKPETDTVAVTPENEPFKKEDGELLFRPAGHGALLENLNDRNADILFIKNIDNVVPDRLKPETIEFKKVLAGVLLDFQERVFSLLRKADLGEDILKEGMELLEEVGIKGTFTNDQLIEKLNRPMRVCGMVKNQGEPGGGPFWVKDGDFETLQIVEGAQVDKADPAQFDIIQKSTHFNPVDIVCGVRNYKGEKFDLLEFRDPKTGFIANKSYQGQPIKAMELPGLWNGSMADWNTIFVEVPIITFNPVKTVNDLLRSEHQA
jgi:hypothetical protein